MITQKPLAETVNYYGTSQKSPDTWIEKAVKEIQSVKGRIIGQGFKSEYGQPELFMILFRIGEQEYKILWEVLPTKKSILAARRQAATMLYHHVKHLCIVAKVRGIQNTFLEFLIAPNGQTIGEMLLANRTLLLQPGESK